MAAADDAGAEAGFRAALARDPNIPEALTNLGLLRERAGAVAEAEQAYRQAIALDPACLQNHLNLGVLLLNGKRFAEAEAVHLDALRRAPVSPIAWSNYGVLLACLKREADAEQSYRTALALDSGYAKARFNLAYLLLRQGRFEEGWASLEARDWYMPLDQHFTCPRWQGEPLAGKSLIIGLEAGLGDMIQFCRYTSQLKAQGAARIAIVCHPGLKSLFSSLSDADEIFSLEDEVPASAWDYWTPPLSLPHYCRTTLASIPALIPYLAADPSRVAWWHSRLPVAGARVGLVWKGNPHFENDADRSLPSLETLAPLGDVEGVHFVSLQKGAGEEEALTPPDGMALLALGRELGDFADTAAVIAGLDLVVCVDTAVAHLAGALGKPCWVLLPDYKTDWRWLAERNDSPWYPRMRLFRQPSAGDWSSTIAAVTEALAAWKSARENHGGFV